MPLNPNVKSILEELQKSDSRPIHFMTVHEARGSIRNPYSTVPVNSKLSGSEIVTTQTIKGPMGDIPIRVYTPPGKGPYPVLVYFHGGGWVLGSLDGVDTLCRRITQIAQVVVISVNYHLAPEHKFPKPVYEAYYVTKWIYDHANEFHGIPTCVAVGGDSAGGNIASAVTLISREKNELKLSAQLLIYPVMSCHLDSSSYNEFHSGYLLTRDAMEWFQRHYLGKPEDVNDPLASPLLCDDLHGLPQTYIVTAECDPVRDDGESYASRLQEAGLQATLRRYSGMIHDFMSFADSPWELDEAIEAIDETARAVRRLLHGEGG